MEITTPQSDNARTGTNTGEITLTLASANVTNFRERLPGDATLNGQVWYLPNVTFAGAIGTHKAAFLCADISA